ncbi:hypothetical protein CCACVL1_08892 [Corchorus capsularis]|uniref:Uncharacterized protein n=1 Tax=Corchorus capsularis TaxID=210143 RepID=A0A1R3IYF6_COCAP|nr:hypothetical protein CCACVL1_08892 [Corchorus capsularis]
MITTKKLSPPTNFDFDYDDEAFFQLQEMMWGNHKKRPKTVEPLDEDRLKPILEVPISEDMYTGGGMDNNITETCWRNLRHFHDRRMIISYEDLLNSDQCLEEYLLDEEFSDLMNLVHSPFLPIITTTTIQPQTELFLSLDIENSTLEIAKAKYILRQYIGASGGQALLNSVKNIYVVGQTKLRGPEETHRADDNVHVEGNYKSGSFVLCQKNPNLWYLEMVVHEAIKIQKEILVHSFSTGCDGNVSWHQTSWSPNRANKEPPRLLRRLFQGLDPKSIANLFSNAVCVGETTVKNEDCFILELKIEPTTLKLQSYLNSDIINHSTWGYFSQKTGLLVQLTDRMLLRRKVSEETDEDAFVIIRLESQMEDYRKVDGIIVAHAGKTYASLDNYGGNDNGRSKVEEIWKIEEVHFNVHGLSMVNFLPPSTN